ncbi:MAG: TonB-dependent receptor plug domain-containing protein [Gemmatimonadetes bacterium]|nr:TonB-dependent receptor plug domain-containing protein [Gemmatimonadota bacterium]
MSDLLRSVGGFRVTGTQGKAVLMSTRGRGSIRTGACYSQLVVDGARWWAPGDFQQPPSVDDFTVDLIEAIEVYPGPADTPPAYAGLGATCGTLVIWTRR